MRTSIAWGLVVGCVVACGGTDGSGLGDGGDNDTGTSSDVTNGNDATPTDGGGGNDVVTANCDAGQSSCGGQCVDTSSDPKNCGGCGIVCNTQCTAGVCQLIGPTCDAGLQQVADNACLTVDTANVYWATGFQQAGSVWKVPVGGGCPALMIGNQASPHGMASDGTNLFFANQGATNVLGSIQRIPVNGTTATPIATNQANPLDVVVDANNVYWANFGDGSVWKSDKTTPNPIKLAGPNGQGHAAHLRVDSTNVYFTDTFGGFVYRVPIAGGSAPVAMTTQVPNPRFIAIDSQNAYFGSSSNTSSAILSVALNGTNASPPQIMPSLKSLAGIETDGTHVWFAEPTNIQPYQASTGEIHRITTGGQNDAILASKQNGPACVAIDSTSVYWINNGGGMIAKTGK